ncbi:MAG: CaiB/BaiF CoA-transferase family protein [Thalassobaculales bacterium]
MTAAPSPQPLSGLLVLDFTTLLPGPLATLLLAEAGARVVKIERPEGDDLRRFEPPWGADCAAFALLNRGKEGLVLDLKDAGDRARLAPLLAAADVLVEQFRPGVMARLGLGYEALAAAHPRLIYCSITGYGQAGPKAGRAGHDLNYIGDAGLLALASGPAGAPVVPPALVADIAGGAYPAMMNILLALRRRDVTGRGCHLDIAMADGALPFAFWALGAGQAGGGWPGNADSLLSGGTPRYRLYPAADGRLVAVAAIEDKFWAAFCTAIGLDPALAEDGRDPAATIAGVAALIAARPSAEWRGLLAAADCCCTIVASLQEAVEDPQFRARGLFAHRVANEAGTSMPALPLPIDPAFRAPPQTLGYPGRGGGK